MEALRVKDLANLLKVSRVTIYKWRASGYLPAPIILGDVPVWDREEILVWMQSKREVRP